MGDMELLKEIREWVESGEEINLQVESCNRCPVCDFSWYPKDGDTEEHFDGCFVPRLKAATATKEGGAT